MSTAEDDEFPSTVDGDAQLSGAPDRDEDDKVPIDPALAVAKHMLERAIERAGHVPIEVGSPGSVAIVRVPSDVWAAVICDAWSRLVQLGQKPDEGDRSVWWHRDRWVRFLATDKGGHSRPDDKRANDGVAMALWEGRALAGFSTEPETLLPADLVRTADYRIDVLPPSADDIARATALITGQRQSALLSDAHAALATPRILRLARRPKQDGDAYIRKLAEMLTLEQTESRATPAALVHSTLRDHPTLERLHGLDEAVAWGWTLKASIDAYRAGQLSWAEVDRGCLLSGPPGTGKSLFARALAATCGVPLVAGSYSIWLGSGHAHQGDMLKAMRRTFSDAKKAAPSIIFIDEIDSFPNRGTLRHYHADWEIQVVNALLAELDGIEGREGVVVVAACNHPHLLDPALVRSGRLDRHVRVLMPNQPALAKILREHLDADLIDESLDYVSLLAVGASGADCERFVRGARARARQAARPMHIDDLLHEIAGSDGRSGDQTRLAAIHEAGHAVAVALLWPAALEAVVLKGSGVAGGATITETSSAPVTMSYVRNKLVMLLSGRAAEDVLLGAPSAGAGGAPDSDLARCSLLAASAAASWGLLPKGNLVWLGRISPTDWPEVLASDPLLADCIRRSLSQAYTISLRLIKSRRRAVKEIALALLDKNALTADEVAEIVARYPATPSWRRLLRLVVPNIAVEIRHHVCGPRN